MMKFKPKSNFSLRPQQKETIHLANLKILNIMEKTTTQDCSITIRLNFQHISYLNNLFKKCQNMGKNQFCHLKHLNIFKVDISVKRNKIKNKQAKTNTKIACYSKLIFLLKN